MPLSAKEAGRGNIARGAASHGSRKDQAKHFFHAAGWKKFEPLWDLVIDARRLGVMTPLLEAVLGQVTKQEQKPGTDAAPGADPAVAG